MRTTRGGVKIFENFTDVIYGWPLLPILCLLKSKKSRFGRNVIERESYGDIRAAMERKKLRRDVSDSAELFASGALNNARTCFPQVLLVDLLNDRMCQRAGGYVLALRPVNECSYPVLSRHCHYNSKNRVEKDIQHTQ